jgi:hypothetical protein
MKNLYKYLLAVATVAMAFTSCSKDEISDPSIEAQKVTFTVTSGSDLETAPASRTEFDEETGQMNWSADGEALEVIQILGSEISHATTEAYTIENRMARFQVTFNALTGSEPYDLTYSAVYPAANYSDNTNDHTKFRIKLPAAQTPTETGFDPNADLLLAKPETRTAQPAEGEELNFRFKRVAAIAKMTLKGIPAGEKLAKVELTASQPMAGYSRTNLKTGEIYDIGYYKEETMTLTLNDSETTGEDVIWFTSLPCVFGEGDSFTVKAYTDKATYEKTVSFSAPEAFKFVSGGLTRFGITGMTRTENVVDEYVLLTDVADLSVGDQIIITSGTDGAVKALSTEQKSNNRGATDIEIASNTITTIPANAQIITLETGMVANTFAFYVEYTDNEEEQTGYLYAASSTKNQLKTQANIDENASWTIEIAADGVASIQAKDSKNRNLLQYNDSDKNNLLFACYEDTKPQKDVYIFYKAGSPKTALETPTGVEAVAKGNEVLVGWNEVSGAASYTVSFEPATIEPRTIESTGEASYAESFTLDYATEYTVSVVANPADTENYKASAPATATFTTGENPNYLVYTMVGDDANLGEGQYIFAALNGVEYQAAKSLYENYTYGFLFVDVVVVESNQIASNTTNDAYAFTLEASGTSGQYYLKDTYGRYMYSTTDYDNYNVSAAKEDNNAYLWTVAIENDGTVNLKNVDTGKWMQFDSEYNSYGAYNKDTGIRPYAFKLNDGSLVPPTPKPILAVSSENVAFAAAGESKEVTYTAENLGSNQVFAAVSGENASQFSATVGNGTGTVTVTAAENTETTAKTATLTLYIAASEGGEHLAEATVALTQAGVSGGESKLYTLTILPTDFSGTSYADNNKDRVLTATAEDGSTMDVTINTNQVMLMSNLMQWQKNNGILYNKTNLGKINSVTLDINSGSFTVYEGSTENPSSTSVAGSNGIYTFIENSGYFSIKVGNATGKLKSITITFNN